MFYLSSAIFGKSISTKCILFRKITYIYIYWNNDYWIYILFVFIKNFQICWSHELLRNQNYCFLALDFFPDDSVQNLKQSRARRSGSFYIYSIQYFSFHTHHSQSIYSDFDFLYSIQRYIFIKSTIYIWYFYSLAFLYHQIFPLYFGHE